MSTKIRLPYSLFIVSWALVLVIGLSGFVLFGNGHELVSFVGREVAKFTLVLGVLGYIVVSLRIRSSLLEQKSNRGERAN